MRTVLTSRFPLQTTTKPKYRPFERSPYYANCANNATLLTMKKLYCVECKAGSSTRDWKNNLRPKTKHTTRTLNVLFSIVLYVS